MRMKEKRDVKERKRRKLSWMELDQLFSGLEGISGCDEMKWYQYKYLIFKVNKQHIFIYFDNISGSMITLHWTELPRWIYRFYPYISGPRQRRDHSLQVNLQHISSVKSFTINILLSTYWPFSSAAAVCKLFKKILVNFLYWKGGATKVWLEQALIQLSQALEKKYSSR